MQDLPKTPALWPSLQQLQHDFWMVLYSSTDVSGSTQVTFALSRRVKKCFSRKKPIFEDITYQRVNQKEIQGVIIFIRGNYIQGAFIVSKDI